ncbi:endo alpha-1,4 polygalactosaminidase [bacterium]|nr:endo alpha-1,4 polygalactosaminidase [bacterium]
MPEYELYKYEDLVIDPDQYQNVWDFPNRTYAYVSMGEIEKYRSYYVLMEKRGILKDVNPDWPDARYVSLKGDIWKKYLLRKVIPNILEKGYKGLFLDTLDSLLTSQQDRKLILDLINSIKKRFPKLKLMANRGLSLLKDLDVDSVLLESTLSHYDFASKKHSIASKSKIEIPKRIKIFSLDYWPRTDLKTIRKLYKRAFIQGYTPLISTIDLQKEPILLYDLKSKLFFNSEKKQFEKKKVLRKILGIYDFGGLNRNGIHLNLESTLNYYGMHCLTRSVDNLPTDLSPYDGLVLWLKGYTLKSPLKLFQLLAKAKSMGLPIMWIGGFPNLAKDFKKEQELHELIWQSLGIRIGKYYFAQNLRAKISYAHPDFHFEEKLSKSDLTSLQDYEIHKDSLKEAILTISVPKIFDTTPCYFSDWGVFLDSGKAFLEGSDHQSRWYMNPYTIIEKVFYGGWPIADATSKMGKRMAYIHIDGDGVLSLSEIATGKSCGEVALEKIFKKYKLKTGVSYIANEIDENYQGDANSQQVANDTFALDHIEAASHTYSHPFSWEKGIVAFSTNPNALDADWDGIAAKQEVGGILNLKFEIERSMEYLSQFLPKNKKLEVIYYSGDCTPTKEQLIYLKKNNILAFNGGDSYFDHHFKSLAYVTSIGRDVDGYKQIYSSNANENTYTDLWNDRYWGFARVQETWENTGFPKRIKPINLYYHFYSLAKLGSFRALDSLYQYLHKNQKC